MRKSIAKYVNTPYDDVFRTLIPDGGSLIIPLINETFHEDYTGDEEIILRQNEHYLTKQDGDQDERVSDSNLLIIGKDEIKNYHYECQSGADEGKMEMLVALVKDKLITLAEGARRAGVTEDDFAKKWQH